jgi:hypothetical protein
MDMIVDIDQTSIVKKVAEAAKTSARYGDG